MIKQIKYFCFFFLLWSLSLIAFNFYIDPIQFYRRSEAPYFIKNQRYQIPGLIKHYPFDTIFIGTSLSENFLSSHLDNNMGTKSINFSISGSSAKEQSQVAKAALSSGKVKNVIWELNYKSFLGEQPNLITGGAFPTYLYTDDILANFYYLFSIDTAWMSIKHIIQKGGGANLETLSYWGEEKHRQFDGIRVIQHYCSIINRKINYSEFSTYAENINNNLRNLIKENNNVKFHLFIPPLSALNFHIGNNKNSFNSFRKQIYKLSSLSNITLYDFMVYQDIITNYNNYKDVMHYSPAISDQILKAIADNKYDKSRINYNRVIMEFDDYLNQGKSNLPDCMLFAEHESEE